MLGEVLLCHLEEVADRERHGCYGQGQVGENEGQGLNGYGYDSWKEREMLALRKNNPQFSYKLNLKM